MLEELEYSEGENEILYNLQPQSEKRGERREYGQLQSAGNSQMSESVPHLGPCNYNNIHNMFVVVRNILTSLVLYILFYVKKKIA